MTAARKRRQSTARVGQTAKKTTRQQAVRTNAPTKQDRKKMGYVGKPPGAPAAPADRNEWYTPPHIINAVREVLGDIELDPMSTPSANQTVGARRIYTKADDALKNGWDARTLFLNPPYSNGTIGPAIDHFLSEWRRGVIGEACVLTNDCLDTRWGQRLLSKCAGMRAIAKRIQFIPGFGNGSTQKLQSNSRGQLMFYFGHRLPVFERVFAAHGQRVRRNNFVGNEDWAPAPSGVCRVSRKSTRHADPTARRVFSRRNSP